LEPGNVSVLAGSAFTARTRGRFEEALALQRSLVELDPLVVGQYIGLGLAAYYAGRLDEAEAALMKAVELHSEHPNGNYFLGQVYLAQSRPQQALAEMERTPERSWRLCGLVLAYHALGRKQQSDKALGELLATFRSTYAYQIAEVFAYRGENDRALEWLERAYKQRDPGLPYFLKGDPLLKNLERDPRYAAFLKKMRLAD
jgi:tetratricopeptide (TPR) repeat protein